MSSNYYDEVFRTSPRWRTGANWEPLYRFATSRVADRDRVLDLGCGPGHLARMLLDCGLSPLDYQGVDWSTVALQQANERCPELATAGRFQLGQLPNAAADHLDWATVVVMVELLEHLDEDLELLASLPRGMRVIATVPSTDSESHVRHFDKAADVVLRYDHLIVVTHSETREQPTRGVWYCIEGRRR